ncbi:hypothetical protein KEM48_007240 [Puccinia striiformis f. sp. tritici PST-130]|nr:hypothetical protein KEM48_007240 [Puccinia striiformis f. sp. tritici PST-130]
MVDRTKDVVEAGFKKLLSLCGDSSGTYTTPNAEAIKFIVRGRLPPPTIEDDAPFLKPQCISKSKKAVNLDDCAAAYSQLPVDATGNFLDDSIPRGIPTSINSRTLKTCTGGGFSVDKGVMGRNGRFIVLAVPSQKMSLKQRNELYQF